MRPRAGPGHSFIGLRDSKAERADAHVGERGVKLGRQRQRIVRARAM